MNQAFLTAMMSARDPVSSKRHLFAGSAIVGSYPLRNLT